MNYVLRGLKDVDLNDIEKTILINRGINDYETYMNLDDECINSPTLLDNMKSAIELITKHIDNASSIHIIVDSDTDGYTSGAILYNYLSEVAPQCNLSYSLHTQKQHGLSKDICIPNDIQLLIIPDAGTNDVEQCKELNKQGIDILILDHHDKEKENPYAVIVNNQIGNYPNKELCGAGVVYKFLLCLDECNWEFKANDYIDLVALGLIADNMDIKSFETKRLIEIGLENIKNKMFKALIEKQSYYIGNEINILNIQYRIVPLLNALIRVGDSEEKELLFRGFINDYEEFDYKKRGSSEITKEDIYTRASRLCSNAKSRQDNGLKKIMPKIIEKAEKIKNNSILVINGTDIIGSSLTGLIAIKVAEMFSTPCLIVNQNDGDYFNGSGRNFNNSPIDNLKKLLCSTQCFEFVQGHPNAFGLRIKSENIPNMIKQINKELKDVNLTSTYRIDLTLNSDEVDIGLINTISKLNNKYCGTGFDEIKILVKNIVIERENVFLMGNDENHFKYQSDEGISFLKFNITDNDKLKDWFKNSDKDTITINIIGNCMLNNYNGIIQPQIIINDYEII